MNVGAYEYGLAISGLGLTRCYTAVCRWLMRLEARRVGGACASFSVGCELHESVELGVVSLCGASVFTLRVLRWHRRQLRR